MKGSRLVSDLLKGEWLIDCHNVEAYMPILDKIIAGEKLAFNPEPKSILNFVDSTGIPLRKNEEGKTNVPPGSIAIVSMIGEVVKHGDYCIYGADEITAALTAANNNPNVIATIFKIDGPGGAVSAIGVFQDFAKNVKSKPIIGLCDSALSLHYWTAVEVCDHIMAENDVSARFGSIGVVLTFADNREAMEEKGIKFHEIYPAESSHKNLAFKHARNGDYKLIQEEFLSPLAKKFQERVKANMPNLNQNVEGILSGKTFFADDALAHGLIHSIGGMKKAINVATIMSSTNNY
jgi:protease-4